MPVDPLALTWQHFVLCIFILRKTEIKPIKSQRVSWAEIYQFHSWINIGEIIGAGWGDVNGIFGVKGVEFMFIHDRNILGTICF